MFFQAAIGAGGDGDMFFRPGDMRDARTIVFYNGCGALSEPAAYGDMFFAPAGLAGPDDDMFFWPAGRPPDGDMSFFRPAVRPGRRHVFHLAPNKRYCRRVSQPPPPPTATCFYLAAK